MTQSQDKSQGDRTHICMILDRTGSMESIKQDTIGGFNSYIAAQKSLPTPATFTLVQFDSQDPFEVIHKFTDIQMVADLTGQTYVPRASTPLYDAVGRGINDLKAGLGALPEALRPKKIVMVIVTDGQENASREFTGAQVRKMIADAKEAGWQFVFLSADESAISDSSSLNIDASNAAFFKKSRAGANEMWERVANRSVAYRSSGVHSMRMDAAGDDALIAKQLKAEYAAQNASAGASAGVGVAQNPNAGASAGAVVGATQNPNAGVAVPGVGVVGADVPPRNERSRGRGKKN
jgi:hypothetical protein